jgi:1,4-alpha-glucan branching enzyme
MALEIHPDGVAALVYADHGAPSDILGPKPLDDGHTVLRALRPWAEAITAVHTGSGQRAEMERIHAEGLFEVIVDGQWTGMDYYFEVSRRDGETETYVDPYAFPPMLTDYDLYLLGEGRHLYSYEKLGAHLREVDGIKGVNFVVWAPNARRVSVVGDFNNWDSRVHPMNNRGGVGFWEIFIPGLSAGEVYKFSIRSNFRGYQAEKSDPYAFYAELRPRTGSIVVDLSTYQWNDDAWMQARAQKNMLSEPMSIYEVHMGSWRRHKDGSWLTYRELAERTGAAM